MRSEPSCCRCARGQVQCGTAEPPSGFRRDVSSEVKTPVDWMPMPFTFEPGESQPLLHDRSAISQELL